MQYVFSFAHDLVTERTLRGTPSIRPVQREVGKTTDKSVERPEMTKD